MTKALRHNGDIGDDEPFTLAEACRLFFGGRLSPSALRTEAAKGNLDIMQIARKDFVTRRAIEEMKKRCLRSASRPVSGSEKTSKPTSSSTEDGKFAQDAARMRLKKLSASLANTSHPNTRRPAEVVPLKSR